MKAEILTLLRETDDYVSGQSLCDRFGVSRTAVWKAIKSLKEAGYEIEAMTNRGYRLKHAADVLTADELSSLRRTAWIGKEIHAYEIIDSTNTRAKELAESGAPDGTLVVADRQTLGKGRRGRGWESPSGVGIFMTILLRPQINPNHASMLTLLGALAVADAITDLTGERAMIKWPNDIVMGDKKVCGILTEMSAQFDYINHIVVGIGINVHTTEFSEEIKKTATSILLETGKQIHRSELIVRILEHFENNYETFLQTEDLSAFVQQYDELLVNRSRQVRVLDPKEPFEGTAAGITTTGELIVDTWESRRLVSSGEVSVRGIYGYV